MKTYHFTMFIAVDAKDDDEASEIAARLKRAVQDTEYKVQFADVDYKEA